MFKVSFKETKDNLSKIIEKKGKTTTVTLKGVVNLPFFWKNIPQVVRDYIWNTTKVEVYENIATNTLLIYSCGIARCHKEDKYDSLFGERLAEARAKYNIYKFFYGIDKRFIEYYNRILYGCGNEVKGNDQDCLAADYIKYRNLCIRESHHIEDLLASKENG